jgi:hypothetical protein
MSGSGLGGPIVYLDPDGCVSFIVRQLSSFTNLSRSPVFKFVHGTHGSLSFTSSQLINTAQIACINRHYSCNPWILGATSVPQIIFTCDRYSAEYRFSSIAQSVMELVGKGSVEKLWFIVWQS